ncbi:hypothetical protein GSI_01543 [Ganoderma sinense ZZ0214-1]|uniref:Protein kinase domain-containing protein n=1 Tax=Ganoderma sinense ZZ0214-1 TaxID=1077348 RepID=A0A2G8SQ92_9APHY|nr:hypothetical protein GSI_01543 [Ganoderma sinense ZZ0214-1]
MKLLCLANVKLHFLELEFDDSYDRLTAGDIIDKAIVVCRASYHEAANEVLPIPEPRPTYYQLHYITDSAAFKLDEAEAGNYDFRQDQPDHRMQVRGWYRMSGQCLQSKNVDPAALLTSEPMQEARFVRWYFIVAESVAADQCPCASIYMLRQLQRSLDLQRAAYEGKVLEMLREPDAATTPNHVAKCAEAYDSAMETTPVAMGRRPTWSWGPDPSLYLAAFARAMNDLENLKDVVIETPPSDRPQLYEPWFLDLNDDEEWERCLAQPFDMIAWISLLADVPEGFTKERKLNERLHKLLEKFFDDAPLILHDRGRDTELDMKGECMTALGFAAIWLVFESKLWNGNGGAPELQAVYAVQRRIMNSRYDYIRAVTACPCLVMGMSGSELAFYAVYFADKMYAMRLCKLCLDRSARAADAEENRAKFQIIRTLGRALHEYYAKLHIGCTYRHTPHLLPQPTSIISEHCPDSLAELKALHLIILDRVPGRKKMFNTHRALFTGTIQHKGEPMRTPVYVKFVTSYGKEAHSFLASRDPPLAPQILFYGEVVSRITMIVMEDVNAVSIYRLLVLDDKRLRPLIQPRTEEALKILHAGGFVHGDIRSPNLLMHPATGCVYIVDFDWAGKQGVARYSTDLNPKIKWVRPPLLMQNKVILQEDDRFMLQMELIDLLNKEYIKREDDVVPAPVLGKRLIRDEGGGGDGDADGQGSDRPSKRLRGAYALPFPSEDSMDEQDDGHGTTLSLMQQVAAI